MVITSVKLPVDVNAGPVYLPWVDFAPDLHAWRDLLVADLGDTAKAYLNSIIVAFLSTALCVLIGSMAAYALARIEYRPRFGTVLLFVAGMAGMTVAAGVGGVDWRIAAAVALALFVLLARALGRRFNARGRQWRHPVLDDLAAHPAAGGHGDPGLHDVPERPPARHPFRPDPRYTVVNLPIVVWLMHDFFLGIPIDLEESAQLDGASRLTCSSRSCCRWPAPASPPPRSWS